MHPVVGAADIDRALEESASGRMVGPTQSTRSCGEQPPCRSSGKLDVARPQLLSQDERLLEVVADELVELERRFVRRALEPLRVALVELGSQLLRHRRVRSLADEEVTEPIGVLPGDERVLWAHQVLADERGELLVQRSARRARRQILDGADVEHLALDRRALEHDPELRVERVDPRLEERGDRRGNGEVVSVAALAHHRDHLLDEERVASRRRGDPLARVGAEIALAEQVVDQRLAVVGAERLEQ